MAFAKRRPRRWREDLPVRRHLANRTMLGKTLAYVAAISHKPPTAAERAIEVPRKLKRHLGLDEDPSWIYTDQVNEFIWPGPDLQAADRLSNLPGHGGRA